MSRQFVCLCCKWKGYKSQLLILEDEWLGYTNIPYCPKCGSLEISSSSGEPLEYEEC